MSNNNNKEQWHMSKTINVTHLLGTISIVISIIAGAITFDRRITTIEQKLLATQQTQEILRKQSEDLEVLIRTINERLARIEGMLVAEKQRGAK